MTTAASMEDNGWFTNYHQGMPRQLPYSHLSAESRESRPQRYSIASAEPAYYDYSEQFAAEDTEPALTMQEPIKPTELDIVVERSPVEDRPEDQTWLDAYPAIAELHTTEIAELQPELRTPPTPPQVLRLTKDMVRAALVSSDEPIPEETVKHDENTARTVDVVDKRQDEDTKDVSKDILVSSPYVLAKRREEDGSALAQEASAVDIIDFAARMRGGPLVAQTAEVENVTATTFSASSPTSAPVTPVFHTGSGSQDQVERYLLNTSLTHLASLIQTDRAPALQQPHCPL